MIDLCRALAVLSERPGPEQKVLADTLGIPAPTTAEYADIFLFQVFPYASVQVGPEGKLGGVAQDRVAGFFRATTGSTPSGCDHLAVLLGAYASLIGREQDGGRWQRAREALLVEHILPWVPAVLDRVADLAGPSYHAWALLLDQFLAVEAARTPLATTLLPTHLAVADEVRDPRMHSTSEFLDALLAPGRAGVILTASDLARAAEDLGLGRRIAERRFVIRCLLDQEPAAFLGWLSAALRSSSERWKSHWLAGTPTGDWWRDRAASTAALVGELCSDMGALAGGSATDQSGPGAQTAAPSRSDVQLK